VESVGSGWHWAGFVAAIVLLLALDLGVLHRRDERVAPRTAMSWVAVWVALAAAFGGFVWWRFGTPTAVEFATGYLIELSLSVDNLFVFVLIFAALRIPARLQHRVLFWGILTALVLRGAMIVAGTALLQRFHWLIYAFGAFLLLTGARLLVNRGDEHHPERSAAFRLVRRIVPSTPTLHGSRFFVVDAGRRLATPLFLALALIELADVVFALDSVPAIFGVTLDPFIVFTSNVFAILGLRSMYFALAHVIARFEHLKVGLALVLVFIGAKMTLSWWVHLPSAVSLAVVATLLGSSVAYSLLRTRRVAAAAARSPTAS
jgi:tellurite resistance protein TerC